MMADLIERIIRNGWEDTIQLCVSDNHSSDESFDYLSRLTAQHQFVKIHRNPRNLGFGPNFWQVAKIADGDFIYFTGDDDRFVDNGLESLLAAIECWPNAGLLLFCSHRPATAKADCHAGKEYRRIATAAEYVDDFGVFFGSFLGNLCFRRNAFRRHLAEEEHSARSAYSHLTIVFRLLADSDVVVCFKPITAPNNQARGWSQKQPIYTAVDMARLCCEHLNSQLPQMTSLRLKLRLARSLPRALKIFYLNSPIKGADRRNPYLDCSLLNLLKIYFG